MEDQEVELIDYLRVIWKRKGLIIGGTLVAAAAVLVVSLSVPKTYEVSRTLKIGKLPGSIQEGKVIEGKSIESREAVMDRLKDHRVLAALIKEFQLHVTPKEMADLVSIDTRRNPAVRFTIQAPQPELATRIADWLADNLIKTHQLIFDKGCGSQGNMRLNLRQRFAAWMKRSTT